MYAYARIALDIQSATSRRTKIMSILYRVGKLCPNYVLWITRNDLKQAKLSNILNHSVRLLGIGPTQLQ